MHPFLNSTRSRIISSLIGLLICLGFGWLLRRLLMLSVLEAVLISVPVMSVAFIICLSAWSLCQTTQPEWKNLPNILVLHGTSLAISQAIWLGLTQGYCNALEKLNLTQPHNWNSLASRILPLQLTMGIFLYVLAVLIFYLIIALKKVKDANRVALERYYQSVQAELKSIKTTIHPHFLFNVLTSLEALIKNDTAMASRVCAQLSDFLRYSLKHGNLEQVTIREELDHIKNYLGIEKIRFGDRLKLVYEVDTNILDEPIIPLLLLPLVENAIKHGIQQILEGGTITVRIKKDPLFFHIQVTNPYECPLKKPRGERIGLQTLQQRIRSSYGDRSLLQTKKQDSLFSVDLFLPPLASQATGLNQY